MSFGQMPIANGFLDESSFYKEFFFEMSIGFSEDLSLLQLKDHPKPEMMFNENYPFFTSSSKHMINHFENYSNWIIDNYPDNNKKLITEINTVKINELIKNETISGGMIPKIKNCLDVASNGVKGVCIIDGRLDHSILFELLSNAGSGTLIRE